MGFVMISLCGCKESAVQPIPAEPYQRWKSHNLHNYTINQVRGCFCLEGGVIMRIVVRADTISSITRVVDGSTLPGELMRRYCTVDSLFAIIRRNVADSLVVRYNETYGFPDTLDINPQLHPIDGGVVYTTSSLSAP
jgi:hypothetical protein